MTTNDPCEKCEEMMQPFLDGSLSDDEVAEAQRHLERCSWCAKRYRFEERHFKLSKERRTAVEMLSSRTRASLDAKKPWLLVGAHSKGWAPEQLLSGPRRTVLWSIPGAVFIVVFWLYTVFSRKRALADKHEAQLQESEREVEALGDFRRGLGAPPPSKIPPSKPPPPRTTRSGVTTTGRAVKRKP